MSELNFPVEFSRTHVSDVTQMEFYEFICPQCGMQGRFAVHPLLGKGKPMQHSQECIATFEVVQNTLYCTSFFRMLLPKKTNEDLPF